MVFFKSNGRPDPCLERLDAAVATELAFGTHRVELSAKLLGLVVAVMAELDDGGSPARDVAEKLERLADQLRRSVERAHG